MSLSSGCLDALVRTMHKESESCPPGEYCKYICAHQLAAPVLPGQAVAGIVPEPFMVLREAWIHDGCRKTN